MYRRKEVQVIAYYMRTNKQIVHLFVGYWLRLFYLLHLNVIVCPFAISNLFGNSFVNRSGPPIGQEQQQ